MRHALVVAGIVVVTALLAALAWIIVVTPLAVATFIVTVWGTRPW